MSTNKLIKKDKINNKINLISPCLIILAGPSGSGKTTFAHKHFLDSSIISTDALRETLSDDEENQMITNEVFETACYLANKRLSLGKTTIIDSTALGYKRREQFINVALENNVNCYLITLNVNYEQCIEAQKHRERKVYSDVIKKQFFSYNKLIDDIKTSKILDEGFNKAFLINNWQETDFNFLQAENGLYDIISDVHGCNAELTLLLDKLGYQLDNGTWKHPDNRTAVFLGDLCDRGNHNVAVLKTVYKMVKNGSGMIGALGNHDWKLFRGYGLSRDVTLSNGLEKTVDEIEALDAESRGEIIRIIEYLFKNAPAYSILDNLVVTHGAIRKHYITDNKFGNFISQNRKDEISLLSLFGQAHHENGELIREYDWIEDFDNSEYKVVFGHDILGLDPKWLNNNVLSLDTGCCFGGYLSAYSYPENIITKIEALNPDFENERFIK